MLRRESSAGHCGKVITIRFHDELAREDMPCDQPGTMCLLSTRIEHKISHQKADEAQVYLHFSLNVDETWKHFVLCESRSADFYPFICSDHKQMKPTNQTDCRFRLCTQLVDFFFFFRFYFSTLEHQGFCFFVFFKPVPCTAVKGDFELSLAG